MSFVYPEFLFALAAVSVPIIIHLFNFRRFRKIYFSDIRFLKDIEVETRSRNQLKNLLILISRILAIAALVIAFAQPVIPNGTGTANNAKETVIYVDNSFSMGATGKKGILLDEAISKAIAIAGEYADRSNIRLLTNDFNPAQVRNLTLEEFKEAVTGVSLSPHVRTFGEVISRASADSPPTDPLDIFLISDMQKNSSGIDGIVIDSISDIYVVPIKASINDNIYIDSCWFADPVRLPLQPDELTARIRNNSNEVRENLTVDLLINGVHRAVGTVTVQPHSFEDAVLSFVNGEEHFQLAELSIKDYPITYDDHYYISYGLTDNIRITNVLGDDAASSIERMYTDDSRFELSSIIDKNIDYSVLENTDLLVCNGIKEYSSGMVGEFMKYADNGGNMMIIPSQESSMSSLNELLMSVGAETLSAKDSGDLTVQTVNLNSSIYKHVFTDWDQRIDLPKVKQFFITNLNTKSNSERLLTLNNGSPLLTAYSFGKGRCYVLASCLRDDWTNFQRHALFVPTFYNLALNSVSNHQSAEIIGNDHPILLERGIEPSEKTQLISPATGQHFMPELSMTGNEPHLLVHGQVKQSGNYLLMDRQDTLQSVSFNYDRKESDIEYLSPKDLEQMTNTLGTSPITVLDEDAGQIADTIHQMHEGERPWRAFLFLALLLLLIETLLIRIK